MTDAPAPRPLEQADVTRLDLTTATGTWLVLSASQTVYRLDLDRWLLRREPGPDSTRGPFDDEWVPLVRIEVLDDDRTVVEATEVHVGRRHLYLTDPLGLTGDYRWWIQRLATRICPADEPGDHRASPR